MTDAITNAIYMVAITALLPLMAVLLVLQVNPYQALVIRGILGAIAALVYVLYGAADVALTEALVGTMLSITLYAIAVRSSMIVRVGVLDVGAPDANVLKGVATTNGSVFLSTQPLTALENLFDKYHVRVELLPYADISALRNALKEKEIHAIYEPSGLIQTRVERLYTILQSGLPSAMRVTYSKTTLT